MKYWKLVLLLIPFMQLSCNKEPAKEIVQENLSFSILGDSYSTFEGYVTPSTNDVWYLLPPDNYINVTDVSQMWWFRFRETMNWKLDHNNSFSGSVLCNWDTTNYYGPHSFIRRADDLGNPDVIIVFGGTNDVWQKAPLGDYQYDDWTEEDLCSFRPGLAFLCEKLINMYPSATIYLMIDSDLGLPFIDSFHTIAGHYNLNCVDLHDIKKDWKHPTASGMKSISDQMVAAIRKMISAGNDT